MTAPRTEIRFLLNDHAVTLADVAASDTLLDHLRLARSLRGTKEGCAEGDCGACTVLVGRRGAGGMAYEPVNACIRLLPSVDLCHVVTVEALGGPNGVLHPIQRAMVDLHGSQCGFCTPGIVMALCALGMQGGRPTAEEIETALQGNLCRCTGYRPIVAAAQAAFAGEAQDPLAMMQGDVPARLSAMDDGRRVAVSRAGSRAILPWSVDDLVDAYTALPDATIVAGSTDVGLWVTKFMREISPAIFVGHLDALQGIAADADGMTLGAGASYAQCRALLIERFPHLAAYWDRIGGPQVRAMGTVGGNIANGSPIGDTPPVLIALGADLTLRKGAARRTIPLEDFFVEYGKQDRAPGEFVESIRIPAPLPDTLNAAYKISKRRDEDISSVCGAFAVTLHEGRITAARLAFGGMAATPKRAPRAEAALTGRPWTRATVAAAGEALADDFTPLTDMRASAEYRGAIARNLLMRFYLEHTEPGRASSLTRRGAA